MKELLSIVVPVYNTEEFLERCLESILSNKYENYEVILVDDGSTDKSPQICDRYAERYSNIHVLHKENGGEASSKNAGIEHAQGTYVAICDSDDTVPESGYQTLMKRGMDTDADVVRGLIHQVDKNTGEDCVKQRTDTVLRSAMAGHYCNIYKKTMLDKYNIRFQPFVLGADLTFMIQVLDHAKNIQRVEEVTYEYLIRPAASKTKSEIQKQDFNHFYDSFRWREWVVNYMNSSEKLLDLYGTQMGGGLCPMIDRDWLKYDESERKLCFESLTNIVQKIDWTRQKVNENGYIWITKDRFMQMTEKQYTKYLKKRFYFIEPIKKLIGR